jgi:flagella basal body P-ring formation protein FlgA
MRILSSSIYFFLAALLSPALLADQPNMPTTIHLSTTDIEQQVAEFLSDQAMRIGSDNIQIEVAKLDTLLALDNCDTALQLSLRQPITRHRHSVQVKCESPVWNIYVPATVSIFRNVVVSQRPLARKQTINANDLALVQQDITLLDGDLIDTQDQAEGLVLRRPVGAGITLTRNMFEQPQMIRKGDNVTIIASSGPVQVSSQGEALENGKSQQQISVRNVQSGRVIKGVVSSTGQVEVAL